MNTMNPEPDRISETTGIDYNLAELLFRTADDLKASLFPTHAKLVLDIIEAPNTPPSSAMSTDKVMIYSRLNDMRNDPEDGILRILRNEGYNIDPQAVGKIVQIAEDMILQLKEANLANKDIAFLRKQEEALKQVVLDSRVEVIQESCKEIDLLREELESKYGAKVADAVIELLIMEFMHDINNCSFQMTEEIKDKFLGVAKNFLETIDENETHLKEIINKEMLSIETGDVITRKKSAFPTAERPMQKGKRRPTRGAKKPIKEQKPVQEDVQEENKAIGKKPLQPGRPGFGNIDVTQIKLRKPEKL